MCYVDPDPAFQGNPDTDLKIEEKNTTELISASVMWIHIPYKQGRRIWPLHIAFS
jgi:hypothetical protein